MTGQDLTKFTWRHFKTLRDGSCAKQPSLLYTHKSPKVAFSEIMLCFSNLICRLQSVDRKIKCQHLSGRKSVWMDEILSIYYTRSRMLPMTPWKVRTSCFPWRWYQKNVWQAGLTGFVSRDSSARIPFDSDPWTYCRLSWWMWLNKYNWSTLSYRNLCPSSCEIWKIAFKSTPPQTLKCSILTKVFDSFLLILFHSKSCFKHTLQ